MSMSATVILMKTHYLSMNMLLDVVVSVAVVRVVEGGGADIVVIYAIAVSGGRWSRDFSAIVR